MIDPIIMEHVRKGKETIDIYIYINKISTDSIKTIHSIARGITQNLYIDNDDCYDSDSKKRDADKTTPIDGTLDLDGICISYFFDFGKHEEGEEKETITIYPYENGSFQFLIQDTFPHNFDTLCRAVFHELVEVYVWTRFSLGNNEPTRHKIALYFEEKLFGERQNTANAIGKLLSA